jgi:outer membrane protein assembly factor BamB
VNPALASGLLQPAGIAVFGDKVFVVDASANTIGKYTTSGETVNPALISGLSFPSSIAVSGGNLFVGTFDLRTETGTIGEYNATTGATVNASLISGLNQPVGIAIVSASVPEVSSTWTLLLLALGATFGLSPLLRRQATDHFRST